MEPVQQHKCNIHHFFLQCRIAQDSCGHVPARTKSKKKSSTTPLGNKTNTNTQAPPKQKQRNTQDRGADDKCNIHQPLNSWPNTAKSPNKTISRPWRWKASNQTHQSPNQTKISHIVKLPSARAVVVSLTCCMRYRVTSNPIPASTIHRQASTIRSHLHQARSLLAPTCQMLYRPREINFTPDLQTRTTPSWQPHAGLCNPSYFTLNKLSFLAQPCWQDCHVPVWTGHLYGFWPFGCK